MRGFETEPGRPATNAAVQLPDQLDSEIDPWFRDMVRGLLGKDAGGQLAIIAGIGPSGERSCYRYAKGTRAASADLLRALLRSKQGKQFLAATMEGSEADWWADYQNLQRRADLLARIVEITKRE